jgi:flagellar assembly protein FliH
VGKIVRGARFARDSYVVAVPVPSFEAAPRDPLDEFDDRFTASQDLLAFEEHDNGVDELAYRQPAPAVQTSVDWEQVKADARALIDRAAADAEKILSDTVAQARKIMADAQASAGTVVAEARERGQQEGMIAGRAAADAEGAKVIAELLGLVESARVERRSILESAEPELVKLAMAIGERIVHEQIAVDPNVVLQNVRQALTRLIAREVVTLRLHPADIETIRRHRDAIVASNDVEQLRMVEDQRVDRGGVVIETEAGTIDAKIGTQLREARRVLETGDAIALSPSAEEGVLHTPAAAS